MSRIVLGPHRYGKAECRLVRVSRDVDGRPGRHEIEDLTVSTALRGDFEACHTEGDNSHVVATDTQKNTVYAFAREHGVGTPERFLLRLARHFVDGFAWVTGAELDARQHLWERIATPDGPHDHAFARTGRETRTCSVTVDGDTTTVVAGFTDCTLLKSTGSEFHGFPRDRYTTLAETDDRVLATSLTATWRYADGDTDADTDGDGDTDPDWDARWTGVRDLLLSTFATTHSLALQQTVYAMGAAVLEHHPEVVEVSLTCPNKHHVLVDLEPFDLDNPGEVFHAADRPYGLIEATVRRED